MAGALKLRLGLYQGDHGRISVSRPVRLSLSIFFMRILQSVLSFFLLFGVLGNSQAASAAQFTCSSSGNYQERMSVPGTINIPNEATQGTVLWRSPIIKGEFICKNTPNGQSHALAYILNPSKYAEPLGLNLELGVTYNGQDYTCPSSCNIELKATLPSCTENCPSVNVPFNYSLFIVKKTPPGDNQDDVVTGVASHKVLQLSGMDINMDDPVKMWGLTLINLHLIKYIKCPITIGFSTQNIDFGTISSGSADVGGVASTREVTLFANKDTSGLCRGDKSVFSISAFMKAAPLSAVNAGENLLIPYGVDNKPFDSVGIQLLRNKTVIPFNQETTMFDASSEISRSQKLDVNVIWRTDRPEAGGFRGGVIMEFYHR